MNQKKAKALRKLARDCSAGLPQVAYQGEEPRRLRRFDGSVSLYHGTPPATRTLAPSSTRAVYAELKAKQL